MLRVTDCIADSTRPALPQPTEWQRVGKQCEAAMILYAGADKISKAGWSLDWVSALDVQGRKIWIVDAHGYGKRFVVRAGEKLTAFVDPESANSRIRLDPTQKLGDT